MITVSHTGLWSLWGTFSNGPVVDTIVFWSCAAFVILFFAVMLGLKRRQRSGTSKT